MKLPPPASEEKTPAAPILLLPSWLFFVENIFVDSTASSVALREQVALQIESVAPVPVEQLLFGFVANPRKNVALCYAAARERSKEFFAKIPPKTLHCLPAFALWNNAETLNPRWEWFATENELTAVFIEPDNPFPTQIRSWQYDFTSLSREDFQKRILAEQALRRQELPASQAEHKEGVYCFGEQITDRKKGTGEIRLTRIDKNGKCVPAARVLNFSFADESLWNADVRDAGTLAKERRERKNTALCKRAFSACAVAAGILLVLQILLCFFEYKTNRLIEKEALQRPQVQTIRAHAKLLSDIAKIQANKLQTIRTVAVLNAYRPNGVGFSDFSGNGTAGTVSVAGTAESIALANEFEKNIRACGLFKNITFSANMSATGTHFSLQCAPEKSEIAKLDFYETDDAETERLSENSATADDEIPENNGSPEEQ